MKMSAEALEWSSAPPLDASLPYVFTNGLLFNGLNSQCGHCGSRIPPPAMRGQLHRLADDRCLMVAKGYCEACRSLTCFNFVIESSDPPKIHNLEMAPAAQRLS
ncbi:hypothetical protein PVT67_10240 [Gallaecimonas kandeliae]|uniref:hypothetical protein n=1 Tax=Gallaecimonas kandeliae TaxID=3029055 RepID=UPI002648799B|nr:hypothetical protein [Gallaecimonas kandeliae]WKE64076.1 hypothetical protein PVT67_10240 [Gallaecimonas kandeliae]